MRRLKRISFFLYSCLLFAVGFYGHYKIEQWFYPGRQTIISQNEIPFSQMQSATQGGQRTGSVARRYEACGKKYRSGVPKADRRDQIPAASADRVQQKRGGG